MALYLITGNQDKFQEVKLIIPEIEQLDLDLDEIQSTDPRVVIKHKLLEASKHQSGNFLVEDTSLEIEALNGLPGTLIKWFLQKLEPRGVAELVQGKNTACFARTTVGYMNANHVQHFTSATITGNIVTPRSDRGFGWDLIFQPDGSEKTFAQMTREEKTQQSMRRLAFEKMKKHLDSEI